MRTTIMEVDINKFNNNIENIQKYVGNKKLMPVLKANAYGTYINKNIDIINKFDIVALAFATEAVNLRKSGYTKEIFILNQPSIDDLEDIINYNLTIGLSDKTFLHSVLDKEIKVHLEIETGMNRTGIKIEELDDFIELLNKSKVIVEGVYTHLSSADVNIDYTNRQLEIFNNAVNILNKHYDLKYIHSSASNGLINFEDNVSNYVRPGIIMYGYESFEGVKERINIEPICKLKTKITFIKNVCENESIGYGRNYITNRKMKIATIPIGYADGFRRELSNVGYVLVNNKKANILGNVCMDSCMIDVTDIDCDINDEVIIWDNDNITLESIAKLCNTINYEILSTISYRVERKFINGSKS